MGTVTIKVDNRLFDGQGLIHTWLEFRNSEGTITGYFSFNADGTFNHQDMANRHSDLEYTYQRSDAELNAMMSKIGDLENAKPPYELIPVDDPYHQPPFFPAPKTYNCVTAANEVLQAGGINTLNNILTPYNAASALEKEKELNPTGPQWPTYPPFTIPYEPPVTWRDVFGDNKKTSLPYDPNCFAPWRRLNRDGFANFQVVWGKDPITLDLDGDGIETFGHNGTSGVMFDHTGEGIKNPTGWVSSDDGFLVLDRNNDGLINNGTELFGDSTLLENGDKAAHGFAALADLDSNQDGVIDVQDDQFSQLKVWRDLNSDGISQAGELFTLDQLGIASLNLKYNNTSIGLAGNNILAQIGSYTKTDGTTGQMGDIYLDFDPLANGFTDSIVLTPEQEQAANIAGMGRLRDLREAAALSEDLALKLEAYTNAQTKAEQQALLPELLEAWAKTDTKFNFDYDKINFGVAEHDPNSSNEANSNGNGNSNAWVVIPKELQERWKDLSFLVPILDSFTNVTTERLAYISPSDAENICNAIEKAFAEIVQGSYKSLLLQTRLKPYIDAITLTVKGGAFGLDFTPVLAKFEQVFASNPKKAFVDMGEFLASQDGDAQWLDGISAFGRYIVFAQNQGTYAEWLNEMGADVVRQLGLISGTTGNDVLTGTKSNDLLFGGIGNDIIHGESGNDVIDGQEGDDTLYGGAGKDTLIGGAGDDILYGENDNDRLIGGAGNDMLYGGYADDTYVFAKNHGQDVIIEDIWGNYYGGDTAFDTIEFTDTLDHTILARKEGNDLVLYGYYENGESITIKDHFSNLGRTVEQVRLADGTIISMGNVLKDGVNVLGSDADDTLEGSSGRDLMYGGAGNDTLNGGAGNDLLEGGKGNDILNGDGGDDVLDGQDGDDSLYGGSGKDTLIGGAGDDVLYGENDNDRLIGGTGNDTLYGGYGDDTYVFAKGHGQDVIIEDAWGNYYDRDTAFDTIEFTDALDHAISLRKDGNDLVLYGYYNNGESITIKNHFSSGHTTEQIKFADGSIITMAQLLKNGITMLGTDADDTITGGAGNDILEGGKGNDTLTGGEGDDTYVFSNGDGQDLVHNYSGKDTLLFKDLKFSEARFMQNGYHLIIYGSGSDRITLNNFFAGSNSTYYQSFKFADLTLTRDELWQNGLPLSGDNQDRSISGWGISQQVYGGSGNESITTGSGNDIIYGGAGNDTIKAGAGNDLLYGGDGNDTLEGGDGDDLLTGGTGNDTLNGGAGNDIYVFNQGDGQDSMYDSQGNNTLIFNDLNFADARFVQNGTHLIIQGAAGDQVTVTNFFYNDTWKMQNYQFKDQSFTLAELKQQGLPLFSSGSSVNGWDGVNIIYGNSSDETITTYASNDRIYGGAGNDTIKAGAGDDLLEGGEGNDTLEGEAGNDILIGGKGNDSLNGGAGNDTYVFNQGDGQDVMYDSQGSNTLVFNDLNFADARFMQNGIHLIIQGATGDQVTVTNFFYNDSWKMQNYQFKDQSFTLAELKQQGLPLFSSGSSVNGWDGVNIIYGSSSDETITTYASNDRIYGGAGNDTIKAGAGDDLLEGGEGNDTLEGEAGNDILIGGKGNDSLNGGAGNDTYVFNQGDGQDVMYDSQGSNTLVFNDLNFADARFMQSGSHLIIYGAGEDQVTVNNFFYSDTWKMQNYQFKDQTITLEEFRENGLPLSGDTQNRTLTGWGTSQQVYGGSGNETITTSSGNDRISGGAGNDTLNGGAGNDTYLFDSNHGKDTITDSSGNDVISFTGNQNANDLWFSRQGNNLLIETLGTGDSITVNSWFSNANYQIETIQLNSGQALINQQVQSLINVMASFAPAAGSSIDVATQKQDYLTQIGVSSYWDK